MKKIEELEKIEGNGKVILLNTDIGQECQKNGIIAQFKR